MAVSHLSAALAAGAVAAVGAVTGMIPLEVGGATVDVLVNEYGPLGIAVYILYRRVDRLEDRIATNGSNQDEIQNTVRDLQSRIEALEDDG